MMEINEVQPRGKRLRSNFVKVGLLCNGQFKLTIPNSIAESEGLERGDVCEVRKTNQGILIRKVEIMRDGR